MNHIVLTVQSCGNGNFRLGINSIDSVEIFKCRNTEVILHINNQEIITKTSCGTPCLNNKKLINKKYKKGFDLYHKNLDYWIKENQLNDYESGHPIKIKFELLISKKSFVLKFIERI